MNIIVISSTVFRVPLYSYGGLEQIAWYCAKGLAELGHKVTLVAPDGSYCPGVDILQCGPAGMIQEKQAYGGFPDIKQKQKNEKGEEVEVVVRPKHEGYWQKLLEADVVIDHSWQKWSYGLKKEGRLKAPILGVCHAPVDTMYEKLPQVDKGCWVGISKDQASHFEALFNVPARHCYNGIDLDFYKRLDLPSSNRFLFLARFSTIKGADIAIECCRRAGVGLDLIGDTTITGEPDYLAKCYSMADGEQIKIHGGCSRGETIYHYSKSIALLHPIKRFREPFGLAPIEAMACGCPVISWRNGAMSETIGGGVGWLVDSEEKMVEAIQQAVRWRNEPIMNLINLREHAAKWSILNMCRRYEELCKEAIEGGW